MAEKQSSNTYAIFPYLRTSEAVAVWGTTLRSSDDLTGVGAHDAHHLQQLFKMFYLRHGKRIDRMMYCVIPGTAPESRLRVMQTAHILGYLLSTIVGTDKARVYFATPEIMPVAWWDGGTDSTMTWTPKTLKNQTDSPAAELLPPSEVPGFFLTIDGTRWYPIADDEPIYPLYGEPQVLLRMDLSKLLRGEVYGLNEFTGIPWNWPYQRLAETNPETNPPDDTIERILRAIEWYNRTGSGQIDTDEQAITTLATAFESLLNLDFSDVVIENENRKAKEGFEPTQPHFIRSVHMLLGNVPRLGDWCKQFYKARNDIAHKGKAPAVHFRYVKQKTGQSDKEKERSAITIHRLVTTGRKIFRLCLRAILSGYYTTVSAELADEFIPNQERLEQILEKLRRGDGFPAIEKLVERVSTTSTVIYEPQNIPSELLLDVTKALCELLLTKVADGSDAEMRCKLFLDADKDTPQSQMMSWYLELAVSLPSANEGEDNLPFTIGRMFFGFAHRIMIHRIL